MEQEQQIRKYRRVSFLLMAILVFYCQSVPASPSKFAYIQAKLTKDGFARDWLSQVYGQTEAKLDLKGASMFFVQSEAALNYDQFLSGKSIARARDYIKTQKHFLAAAEQEYGVDQAVVTAIILVETRLGKYTGNRGVLNTLSTIASLGSKPTREALWLSIESSKRFSRKKFDQRADQKSAWAYQELKAYLRYARQEAFDPARLKGSFAGAIGICQFMPSNVLKLGVDGNKDGKINLFDHSDAIFSVANYLKYHGWKRGISRKKAYQVLLRYNYSKYYVNTLLKLRDRLGK